MKPILVLDLTKCSEAELRRLDKDGFDIGAYHRRWLESLSIPWATPSVVIQTHA